MTSRADFQTVFQQGKRIDRPSVIVLWRDTGEPRRAGFAVTRHIQGAVKRNRARRRLREAYRAARGAAPDRVALVIIGRAAALSAPFGTLIEELRRAFELIPLPRRS